MPTAPDPNAPAAPRAWWKKLPTGIAGATFWLALWFGLLWLLGYVPAVSGTLLSWMQVLVGVALTGLAVPLAWRLIHKHLLWSLRNKLILTYLLIGLAPVLLFVTLVTISSYVAAGQFSIHLADSRMRQELEQIGEENASRTDRLARAMSARNESQTGPPPPRRGGERPGGGSGGRRPPNSSSAGSQAGVPQATDADEQSAAIETEMSSEAFPDPLRARLRPHTSVYLNGVPLHSNRPGAENRTPLGLPPWAADLHGQEIRYLVLDGGDLSLVAINQRRVEGSGGLVTVVTSLPVDAALLDYVAKGLGRVQIAGLMPSGASGPPMDGAPEAVSSTPRAAALARGERVRTNDQHASSVFGGTEPFSVNICDFRVSFFSTLDTRDWETGETAGVTVGIWVHSRPSLLYRQLFGPSLSGGYNNYIRDGLIALCVIFLLIEVLALWMAMRLSGSITSSVQELYAATQRVDRGDFMHRIAATQTGQQDQLGELSRSFNRMTGSLEKLLVEQHEKERLQSELTIAQEVQANLFPHHVQDLPALELHGICRPARSVSGDYYDFLIFHHPDNPDRTRGRESGVGIAIGDISGKGISAALLMATLHSAVRAYRLVSEELVYSESVQAALSASQESGAGDGGKLFESPGQILSMLNRHLYRTTQRAKYATLFLAHYDADTSKLTYSNAGHLPPLVLGLDGKVRRLDCGGTVVGLMDGMRYEEGHIQMHPGDILVGYSDGITEPENDFGEFGEERLMEVVARYRDQPLHVISAQVMLALDAWIGAEEQPDDITLVLARQL
jgi:phosphoserine phosphatase RsbU/P